jgi:hypothetical protein
LQPQLTLIIFAGNSIGSRLTPRFRPFLVLRVNALEEGAVQVDWAIGNSVSSTLLQLVLIGNPPPLLGFVLSADALGRR